MKYLMLIVLFALTLNLFSEKNSTEFEDDSKDFKWGLSPDHKWWSVSSKFHKVVKKLDAVISPEPDLFIGLGIELPTPKPNYEALAKFDTALHYQKNVLKVDTEKEGLSSYQDLLEDKKSNPKIVAELDVLFRENLEKRKKEKEIRDLICVTLGWLNQKEAVSVLFADGKAYERKQAAGFMIVHVEEKTMALYLLPGDGYLQRNKEKIKVIPPSTGEQVITVPLVTLKIEEKQFPHQKEATELFNRWSAWNDFMNLKAAQKKAANKLEHQKRKQKLEEEALRERAEELRKQKPQPIITVPKNEP